MENAFADSLVAQEDQQTASRIQEFMKTLHEAKAEWGMFHMLIAQEVLHRPIHVAQPVEGKRCWLMEPINDIISQYVWENIDMPEAPRGEPLRLLPTKMNNVHVPLASISHWDPLLPVPENQKNEDAHEYAQRQSAMALEKEKSAAYWHKAIEADPILYGNSDEKEAFLAREAKEMEQRSRAWGQQAVSLRDDLGLQPTRVDADGACGLSSLSMAAGGTASHKEKESLRREVCRAAEHILKDVRFQKLLFFLEGDPARDEAAAALETSKDSPETPCPAPVPVASPLTEATSKTIESSQMAHQDTPLSPTVQVVMPSSVVKDTVASATGATLETSQESQDPMRTRWDALEMSQVTPMRIDDACAGDGMASSDKPAVANNTDAEADSARAKERSATAYPWRGRARAQQQTSSGSAKGQSPIQKQTRSNSRSRSPSRGSSQLTQPPTQEASEPGLVNQTFGISFSGIKRRRPEDNQDPVREQIDRLRTIGSEKKSWKPYGRGICSREWKTTKRCTGMCNAALTRSTKTCATTAKFPRTQLSLRRWLHLFL